MNVETQAGTGVRVYVDAWDPSYGSGLDLADSGPTAESSAQLRTDVEVPAGAWQPMNPACDARAPDVVLLVDGVRRIDARIWVEEADGALHPGLAASYAAGVVRCDLRRGRSDVIASRIARGVFTPSSHATDMIVANTTYTICRITGEEPAELSAAVQPRLHTLEQEVSVEARATTADDEDLLVVDGPLRGRQQLPRALGYVKSHRVQYLPPELSTVVGRLRPGQRCPVFLLGTTWHRYTWYLKLPGPVGSPWSGVVRVEASADLAPNEVIRLADVSTVTLPRFASTPYKDSRAPQNLTPIAGLERKLRAMLGDQRLLVRSLTATAAAQRVNADAAMAARPNPQVTDGVPVVAARDAA